MPPVGLRLPMARKLTPDTIADIVRRHTPDGWTVKQSRGRKKFGVADGDTKCISVPVLEHAGDVLTFLHECSHVHLGHFRGGVPPHIEEYQAERMSFAIAASEGVTVSRANRNAAKAYVAWHIYKDEKAGRFIEPRVRQWCGA